jgi:hypothetical protein
MKEPNETMGHSCDNPNVIGSKKKMRVIKFILNGSYPTR